MSSQDNNMCRLCRRADESQLVSVYEFSRLHDGEIIAKIINSCLQLQITTTDGLPQKICKTCQVQLDAFYLLGNISLKSDYYFRTQLALRSSVSISESYSTEDVIIQIESSSLPGTVDDIEKIIGEIKAEPPEISDEPSSAAPVDISELVALQSQALPPPLVPLQTQKNRRSRKSDKNKDAECDPLLYGCLDCDYRSAYRGNAQRHIKIWSHSGLQKVQFNHGLLYSCERCPYKSAFKNNVARHLRAWQHVGMRAERLRDPKIRTKRKIFRQRPETYMPREPPETECNADHNLLHEDSQPVVKEPHLQKE